MKEARNRIWVDPFQTRLFCRLAVYSLVHTLTLFNFLFAWRLLKEGRGDLWQQFVATVFDNVPLFVTFLFLTPWLGFDAVRFANRLVGPLARFRETMQKVTANESLRRIRLRQGDFLVEMQEDFNAMLAALDERRAVKLASNDGEAQARR